MTTCYGGIGDTSLNDTESQDIDGDSQENNQGDVNDQEHNEFDSPVALQHLNHNLEWLRQTVKEKDNDPRDAIKHLEQKLNQLSHFAPPQNPLEKY